MVLCLSDFWLQHLESALPSELNHTLQKMNKHVKLFYRYFCKIYHFCLEERCVCNRLDWCRGYNRTCKVCCLLLTLFVWPGLLSPQPDVKCIGEVIPESEAVRVEVVTDNCVSLSLLPLTMTVKAEYSHMITIHYRHLYVIEACNNSPPLLPASHSQESWAWLPSSDTFLLPRPLSAPLQLGSRGSGLLHLEEEDECVLKSYSWKYGPDKGSSFLRHSSSIVNLETVFLAGDKWRGGLIFPLLLWGP